MVEALANLEADTCSGCGGRWSETQHRQGIPNKWVATFSVCDRCVAIEDGKKYQYDRYDKKVEEGGGHVYHHSRNWMAMTKAQAKKLEARQQQLAATPTTE